MTVQELFRRGVARLGRGLVAGRAGAAARRPVHVTPADGGDVHTHRSTQAASAGSDREPPDRPAALDAWYRGFVARRDRQLLHARGAARHHRPPHHRPAAATTTWRHGNRRTKSHLLQSLRPGFTVLKCGVLVARARCSCSSCPSCSTPGPSNIASPAPDSSREFVHRVVESIQAPPWRTELAWYGDPALVKTCRWPACCPRCLRARALGAHRPSAPPPRWMRRAAPADARRACRTWPMRRTERTLAESHGRDDSASASRPFADLPPYPVGRPRGVRRRHLPHRRRRLQGQRGVGHSVGRLVIVQPLVPGLGFQ